MRVLMLSWEYPPETIGGLSRHVEGLAEALASLYEEVHVVTCVSKTSPTRDVKNGVWVHRVENYPVEAPDLLISVLQKNFQMLSYCIQLLRDAGPFDILHAHDWLVAYAAGKLKHSFQLPLVATIHATEAGRNQGLHSGLQRYINSIEWWLTYEAWRVVVCSEYMKKEVHNLFKLPLDKLRVIPNGVEMQKLGTGSTQRKKTKKFSVEEEDDIVFFVGRLVNEKGVQVLLESVPFVVSMHPSAKFIIAGEGPMQEELTRKVQRLGIKDQVVFTGYISDEERNWLYKVARVAVFPSLYEPFGIVALEAMAAGTPVLVSDTGGLAEIVKHGINGLKVRPGNADLLASNIVRLLKDHVFAEQLKFNAAQEVKARYGWLKIAADTMEVYREVQKEIRNVSHISTAGN